MFERSGSSKGMMPEKDIPYPIFCLTEVVYFYVLGWIVHGGGVFLSDGGLL